MSAAAAAALPDASHPHISDDEYVQMRDKLNQVLRMPANKRWIADWLFRDNDACFHPNIPLSKQSFDHTLGLHVHRFYTEALSHNKSAISVLFQGMKPHHCRILPSDLSLAIDDIEMLFLPVAQVDNVAVGYCLAVGLHAPPGSPPKSVQYHGRFAFDSESGDLLSVYHGAPTSPGIPSFTVLLGARKLPNGSRDFFTIVCPKKDYNFERLPSTILSASRGCPVRRSFKQRPATSFNHADCLSKSVSTRYPCEAQSDATLRYRAEDSSAFDERAVKGSLEAIGKAMVAEIHARRFSTNFMKAGGMWATAEVGPGVRKSFELADDLLVVKLRDMILQRYCMTVHTHPREEFAMITASNAPLDGEEEEEDGEVEELGDVDGFECTDSFFVCVNDVQKRRRKS